jgi:UDP-galactopyranose mutase
MRYFIQDYYSGLNITKDGYTRYFKTLNDAENFIVLLTNDGHNDEDNFFVVAENEDGEIIPIEY